MSWRRGRGRSDYGGYGGWAPYVPVDQRRAKAAAYAKKLEKKGRKLTPVVVEGRTIARSIWGQAWCDNLEAYSDFANRMPRGRTYVRNGSVIDLQIAKGKVTAMVSGSEIYELTISIETLAAKTWTAIKHDCARSIASLIDLLQGRFDRGVMDRLTRAGDGLFPHPKEIKTRCSCPDYAGMCKHVAAVLYGVGARLDHAPELLFTLRNIDHLELLSQAVASENLEQTLTATSTQGLSGSDLGEVFGIELDSIANAADAIPSATKARSRRSAPASSTGKAPRVRTTAKASKNHATGTDNPVTVKASVRTKAPAKKTKAQKNTTKKTAVSRQRVLGRTPAGKRSSA